MQLANNKFNYGVLQLRGLAALAVVFAHYGSNLENYPVLSNIFNNGQIGVHVFFLISGYIISFSLIKNNYQPNNFFKYLYKRMLRINPPYIVTIFLILLTFWGLNLIPSYQGKSVPFNLGQFISHIFYITPFTKYEFYNHIFWTLCVEFQFYILIGLIYFLNQSVFYKSAFLLVFSLSTFLNFENSYYLITNYAPIFSLGIGIMEYSKSKHWAFIGIITVNFLIIFLTFYSLITMVLFFSSLIIHYCKKSSDLLRFLGKISYSLYLIHPLVLIYILGISKRMMHFKIDELGFLLIKVTISLGIAYLFYIIIEKKIIHLSNRVNYNGFR